MEYILAAILSFLILGLNLASAEWVCTYSYTMGGIDVKTCDYGCCEQDCCPYDSTGLKVAGGCIGAVVILVITLIVLCRLWSRRRRQTRSQAAARLPAVLNTPSVFVQNNHSAAYYREHYGYDQPREPSNEAMSMSQKMSG